MSSLSSLPAVRSYAYWVTQYRRTWRGTVITSVVSPVMYLAAMGVGLGSLVKVGHGTGGLTYLQFVAPGLLAATAM
jgi:lipooligosaccharide transport system permease protein